VALEEEPDAESEEEVDGGEEDDGGHGGDGVDDAEGYQVVAHLPCQSGAIWSKESFLPGPRVKV